VEELNLGRREVQYGCDSVDTEPALGEISHYRVLPSACVRLCIRLDGLLGHG
jgi:hypothetical protein